MHLAAEVVAVTITIGHLVLPYASLEVCTCCDQLVYQVPMLVRRIPFKTMPRMIAETQCKATRARKPSPPPTTLHSELKHPYAIETTSRRVDPSAGRSSEQVSASDPAVGRGHTWRFDHAGVERKEGSPFCLCAIRKIETHIARNAGMQNIQEERVSERLLLRAAARKIDAVSRRVDPFPGRNSQQLLCISRS